MRLRFGRSWRSQAPAATPPVVFSRRESNTQQVAALDARAEVLRLRIGVGIAEARAMFPTIEVIEEDPAADRSMLEALADWCDRYTPLVALDGADGLFLDITGCAHLFGGERALLDDLMTRFSHQGFDARAAIASTPGAAWAGARHASATILEPGEEAGFIAPLPLAALRLDQPTRESLQSVGLRVAGAVMNAPRAPLVRRFGKLVTLRLDQALGRVEEPVSPRLPPPLLSVERRFFEPLTQVSDIEELVPVLGRQLRGDLERREEGARHLELQLFRVDGAVSRVPVLSSRPLRDPRLIGRLFRERFAVASADIDPGYGFDLVRLAVLQAAPFTAEQGRLDEGDSASAGDMALFADRVRSRFGTRSIGAVRLVASHMPERAVAAGPDATVAGSEAALPVRERPVRLFAAAETIEVMAAEIPEGPPGRFRWRNVSYSVTAAEGPERMAPEWWRSEETDVRDYFRVEDETGRRYWLYREGQYGVSERPPRWFMQGMFA
ncbi:MAG: DNA polymerase Y family protein [Mesorhizobium sp.]